MLWVSNSFVITEMEFSPFCGKPLSLRIKKYLAEKLKPARSLFKCFAACFFSAVCGQIPHPDFVSGPLHRACGSSDDTISRRYVRQMCVKSPSQMRHWLLRFNTNMEPNPKLWLCSDPKLKLNVRSTRVMHIKSFPLIWNHTLDLWSSRWTHLMIQSHFLSLCVDRFLCQLNFKIAFMLYHHFIEIIRDYLSSFYVSAPGEHQGNLCFREFCRAATLGIHCSLESADWVWKSLKNWSNIWY